MTSASTQLSVVNPTFDYGKGVGKTNDDSPYLDTLSGKVVGLLWNAKPGGDVALRTAREMIEAQHEGVEFRFFSGHQPHPPKLLTQVNEEVDAVITATAD